MTFKDILNNYNVDGKIYVGDVRKLLKWNVSFKEAEEIRDQLQELKESHD